MKKQAFVFLFVLAITQFISAQSIVRFTFSKPYAVLNFIEAAAGTQSHSSTFKAIIDSGLGTRDTTFNKLAAGFRNLDLSYSYRRDEFPANRRPHRSTYDLIIIAAVKSGSLSEFRDNTIGILPNSNHQELFRILEAAEIYYDRVIWNESRQAVSDQIKGLKEYESKANDLFRSFRAFYKSSWTDEIPFNVTLFPIPAKSGNTSATPHANTLCVGVLTGKKDLAGTMSVVVHEMCHVLYDEETAGFQHELDAAFTGSTSPYKNVAYNFFDESVATALGNGWAYEYLSGKTDTTAWYNNEYINGFAHAIYPLVKTYLQSNKAIDKIFVEEAIALFGKTYPRSLSDYSILLNNMYLYSDAESGPERQEVKNVVGKYFQSSRYNFSSPILHEYSIESLKNSKSTQLIVIDRDQEKTISELKKIFPALENILKGHQEENYITGFYDDLKRAVIIVRVKDKQVLDQAFRLLKQKQYLDAENPFLPIN